MQSCKRVGGVGNWEENNRNKAIKGLSPKSKVSNHGNPYIVDKLEQTSGLNYGALQYTAIK